MSWFRWRKPPEEVEDVAEAVDKRDALFAELDEAIREVDKVQSRLMSAYRLAEAERTKPDK